MSLENAKNAKQGIVTLQKHGEGPWKADGEELKPCWSRAVFGKFASPFEHYKEFHIPFAAFACITSFHMSCLLLEYQMM